MNRRTPECEGQNGVPGQRQPGARVVHGEASSGRRSGSARSEDELVAEYERREDVYRTLLAVAQETERLARRADWAGVNLLTERTDELLAELGGSIITEPRAWPQTEELLAVARGGMPRLSAVLDRCLVVLAEAEQTTARIERLVYAAG